MSQKTLIKWYQKNKRTLPWRKTQDPYAIWISEIMLQQTTVNTVIPYYTQFLHRFKTVESLAKASLGEVMKYWSGLGYYSRAKNLHKAAQIIYKKKHFPQSHKELLKLPGFGMYTARAVSSLAFNEQVGVLDTNVIRVLSRYLNLKSQWWKKTETEKLQKTVDQWAKMHPSSTMNQALMELGALICTSNKPTCLLCPLKKNCQALKQGSIHQIPLLKPNKPKQIWLWKPHVVIKKNRLALIKNTQLPFLKGQLLLPGKASEQKKSPLRYHFTHSITHYMIYVQINSLILQCQKDVQWIKIQDIKKHTPSRLIQKTLIWTENNK